MSTDFVCTGFLLVYSKLLNHPLRYYKIVTRKYSTRTSCMRCMHACGRTSCWVWRDVLSTGLLRDAGPTETVSCWMKVQLLGRSLNDVDLVGLEPRRCCFLVCLRVAVLLKHPFQGHFLLIIRQQEYFGVIKLIHLLVCDK